jgi:hypothetical protein
MHRTFTERLKRLRRGILWATTIVPALSVLILILVRFPEYWKWIASEDTPMTTLEVAVMYTTALVCWACAGWQYLDFNSVKSSRWFVLGAGFLWLALDDRFAIHERVRDGFLAPRHIALPFLPIAAGDFILLLYMLMGLLLLRWVMPILAEHSELRKKFLAGVIVAAAAVILDAYNIEQLDIQAQRLEQTIEEILELIAQVFFLQGAIVGWLKYLNSKSLSPPGRGT